MRDAFSKTLVRLAKADRNVLLITGDHGYALFDEFRRECPQQYINAGIAEQNMVGVAAGLARQGFRPFVYGLSAFVPVRVVEQIKLDVAHDNLPVVFIGDGAGFVYSHLGTSHQSTEDIACTRSIPNLSILSPSDRFEVEACMEAAYEAGAPIYFRMGKSDRGDVHSAGLPHPVRAIYELRPQANDGIAFFATGSFTKSALALAESHFSDAGVWSVPSIKPLDADAIVSICKKSTAAVVFEEHSIMGGLGAAISEVTSQHCPLPILRIGIEDRFSHYCGTYDYLLKEHGLDQEAIRGKISTFLEKAKPC